MLGYLFFDRRILDYILLSTNERLIADGEHLEITMAELKIFFGLLYIGGALCFSKSELTLLWSQKFGMAIFKEKMSFRKFRYILKYLRFKKINIRKSRVEDKFCPIRNIFEMFTSNCIVHCNPHPFLAVDEQLIPIKNRCKLIQYLPAKPDKFGVKIWMMVDCKSKYVFNQNPYLGSFKKELGGNQKLGDYVVKNLAEPILNKGYNISIDNFFTSLNLVHDLPRKNTTIVGTVRNNIKKKCLYESELFQESSKGTLLVSYQHKTNKNVCLLSSFHKSCGTIEKKTKA